MRVGIDCQETRRLYEKLKIGCSDQTKPDNSWQAHFSKPVPNHISTAAAQQSAQTPVERFDPPFISVHSGSSQSVDWIAQESHPPAQPQDDGSVFIFL